MHSPIADEPAPQTRPDGQAALPSAPRGLGDLLRQFHADEGAVAYTEYLIVFILVTIGATIALLGTAAYVKAYRDFLVWWLAHPAV